MGFLDETGLARFLSNLKSWINSYGNAASATKLASARKLKTSLASSADATFDGSANQESIPVTGVLPIANGGTGSSTQNFVDLSTNQTIAGDKTFSGSTVFAKSSLAAIVIKSTSLDIDNPPVGNNSYEGLVVRDKNDKNIVRIYDRFQTDGWNALIIETNQSGSTSSNALTFYIPPYSDPAAKSAYADFNYRLRVRDYICRNAQNGVLNITGGTPDISEITPSDINSRLSLYGANYGGISLGGQFALVANNGTTSASLAGSPDGSLTWNGQAIQTASDERLKTPLAGVPDEVLDAWGDVQWGQFQYLDAVERKGEAARQHLGMIAQKVKRAFEARGLDACAYGILCHELREARDWDEEQEDSGVEHFHEDAVDLWTVRYTEALAMEAAYQRRRADRLEARIAVLEAKLDG